MQNNEFKKTAAEILDLKSQVADLNEELETAKQEACGWALLAGETAGCNEELKKENRELRELYAHTVAKFIIKPCLDDLRKDLDDIAAELKEKFNV